MDQVSRMRETFVTIILEPNVLLREGLRKILHASFRNLKTAASIEERLLDTVARHQFALLILGPGNNAASVVDQIGRFKKTNPMGRVAVVTDQYVSSEVISAFRAGANAYFVNIATCDAFVKSLELVMLGGTLVPAEIMPWIIDQAEASDDRPAIVPAPKTVGPQVALLDGAPHLSIQERRILALLIDGDSNKTIARKVGIAEATVKVHVKAILRKTRVSNRTQAAVWAMNNGLLDIVGGHGQTRETEIVASAISLGRAITAPRR